MKEPAPIPTLEEFLAACETECGFLAREFGFVRMAEPREYNEFSVRFRKGELGVDLYGENWGQAASCDLFRGQDRLPLSLIVPAAVRRAWAPKDAPRGQLAQIRTIAAVLRQHASDFLGGDMSRFDPAFTEWQRMTQWQPPTEAARLERERALAVTNAGHAFKRSDFAEVVRLLEPHEPGLSAHQRKLLQIARDRLRTRPGA